VFKYLKTNHFEVHKSDLLKDNDFALHCVFLQWVILWDGEKQMLNLTVHYFLQLFYNQI